MIPLFRVAGWCYAYESGRAGSWAMKSFDINIDCGESYGIWTMGADEELMPIVSTANAACGFHAGDPMTMVRTIDLAKANGVAIGAHPGLPDIVGFGRRHIDMTPDETHAIFAYQIGALQSLLRTRGMALHHVKSHGAYYAILNQDKAQAEAVVQAVIDTCDAPMLYYPAPARTHLLTQVALDRGVEVVQEIYFDLPYDRDGNLVLERAKNKGADLGETRRRLADYLDTGELVAHTGERIDMSEARSICLHGDGVNAPALAQVLREVLEERGYALQAVAAPAVAAPKSERGLAAE